MIRLLQRLIVRLFGGNLDYDDDTEHARIEACRKALL